MSYSERWSKAKQHFEEKTGKKKPEPKGVFNAYFNHTGLTTALKDADNALEGCGKAKEADRPKLIKGVEDKVGTLGSAVDRYVETLVKEANAQKFDNQGQKDVVYRELKVLSAELKDIKAKAQHAVNNYKVALQGGGAHEQTRKQMKTMLEAALTHAKLAIKKVMADPTYKTFHECFASGADTPGRKVQLQLNLAAKMVQEQKLPSLGAGQPEPGDIGKDFTPWQGQNSAMSVLADTATKEQVIARVTEFRKLLKRAEDYYEKLVGLR
jgi:hypothetical protein